jgi:hypothetical protein
VSAIPIVAMGTDARRRLAELDLDAESLLDVGRRGMAAAASCTSNHPAVLSGILGWGETVCALREFLLPKGWSRLDEGNLPLTVNDANTLGITVATGDEDTGRPEGSPCTKSKKGPRVASAVSANQLQLFPVPVALRTAEDPRWATWLLLIHRDHAARELRCELSRPVNIGEDGRVDGWSERIILGAIPFDDDTILVRPAPTDSPSPDIVVEVKRRA